MSRTFVVAALLLPAAALAQTPAQIPYGSPRDAYVALSKDANAKLARNQEGWAIVEVSQGPNAGIWTFPPQSHATFPSVVRRQVLEKDGNLYIAMDVLCGGSKPACDQLVQEFNTLNDRIAKDANEKQKKAQ